MSVMPAVVDSLIALGKALETVQTLDGYQVVADPGDYLMVGVDDPNSLATAQGGESDQDWRYVGHQTSTEDGFVRCVALSWTGDIDALKTVRDAAFDTLHRLETSIKTDPTMGAVCQYGGIGHVSYIANITDRGSEVLVVFTVKFKALI